MSLGAITIVSDDAAQGPVKFTRITLVGDGAYPAGGSVGFEAAFQAKVGEKRKILMLIDGGSSDERLEYSGRGAAMAATASASTDLITANAHGLSAGDAVYLAAENLSSGANKPPPALPGGLAEGTPYYVIASGLTANAFKVSATSGGSAIDLTSNGAGFSVTKAGKLLVRVVSTAAESAVADQSGVTYSNLMVVSR